MSGYSIICLIAAILFIGFALAVKKGKFSIASVTGNDEDTKFTNEKQVRNIIFKYFILVAIYYLISIAVIQIIATKNELGLLLLAIPILANKYILRNKVKEYVIDD